MLGKNFISITYIGSDGLEGVPPCPGCTVRTSNSAVEPVALSKVTERPEVSALAPRCACGLGDPLGVRAPSESCMEWIHEANPKEFVRGVFTNPVRMQGSWPHSDVQFAPREQTEGSEQTLAGYLCDGLLWQKFCR